MLRLWRSSLILVFALGFAGPRPAQGAFILVENFEDVALGADLKNNNAGESFSSATTGSAVVVVDPLNAANRVARVTGTSATLFVAMPTIANGATGTLFYQISRGSGLVNMSLGASDVASPPSGNFGSFESQLNVNRDPAPQPFQVRDAGTFDVTQVNFSADALFDVWHVIDNSDASNPQGNDTTRVYVQGPNDLAPILLKNGVQTDFVFRNGVASNDLITFLVMTGGSGTGTAANTTFYVDNIYVDPSGANFKNPAIPEPATLSLLGLGLLALARRKRKA